jgi:hypothetical protein
MSIQGQVIKFTNGSELKGLDISSAEAIDSDRETVEEYWDDSKVAGYRFYLRDNRVLTVGRNMIAPGYEENVLDAIDTM